MTRDGDGPERYQGQNQEGLDPVAIALYKAAQRQLPSECDAKGHDWAPTGVYVGGKLTVPCRRPACRVELRQIWQEQEGPGTSIDGMELDIEDDPLGGVAKVVCREAAGKYDKLDLKAGDVVLDIGAHVGIVSIYLAKRYPGVQVYSFEPVLVNYAKLLRNVNINLTVDQARRFVAVNKAVTGDGRMVAMSVSLARNSGGGSIYSRQTPNDHATSTTLPEIFANRHIERCALLKIDCEGAEYEILSKDESLLDKVTYLRGEFHVNKTIESLGWSPDKLLALCRRHIRPENIDVTVTRMGD